MAGGELVRGAPERSSGRGPRTAAAVAGAGAGRTAGRGAGPRPVLCTGAPDASLRMVAPRAGAVRVALPVLDPSLRAVAPGPGRRPGTTLSAGRAIGARARCDLAARACEVTFLFRAVAAGYPAKPG